MHTTAIESSVPTVAQARKALLPFQRKRNGYAFWLLAVDLCLFSLGQWLAIASGTPWLQVPGMLLTWIAIVRLFVIGHDACHQALTSSKPLNDWLGRIAFLVSLTPYSLWRVGHNVMHHGFNNLRGRDFVWEPKTPEEYAALSPGQQRLERIYRSAAGPALYYFVDIWWRRLWFPNKREMPAIRAEFTLDSLLVTVTGVAWLGLITTYCLMHGTSVVLTLLLAMILPFVLWNWTMGLIVYMHHTHPDLHWYDDKRVWQQHAAQISETLHLVMPGPVGRLMHHIMEHPAHHLDGTIPLYHLKQAQQRLKDIGAKFISTPLTLKLYLQCVKACKLYDYTRNQWVPFPSQP